MRAVVYTRYGPPDVVHLVDVEKPVPRRDEVLIRVRATTVSAADVRCRAFRVPLSFWIPARLALGILTPRRTIPGGERAGDIEEVGSDLVRFKKGDQVFGEALMRPGAGLYIWNVLDAPTRAHDHNRQLAQRRISLALQAGHDRAGVALGVNC